MKVRFGKYLSLVAASFFCLACSTARADLLITPLHVPFGAYHVSAGYAENPASKGEFNNTGNFSDSVSPPFGNVPALLPGDSASGSISASVSGQSRSLTANGAASGGSEFHFALGIGGGGTVSFTDSLSITLFTLVLGRLDAKNIVAEIPFTATGSGDEHSAFGSVNGSEVGVETASGATFLRMTLGPGNQLEYVGFDGDTFNYRAYLELTFGARAAGRDGQSGAGHMQVSYNLSDLRVFALGQNVPYTVTSSTTMALYPASDVEEITDGQVASVPEPDQMLLAALGGLTLLATVRLRLGRR